MPDQNDDFRTQALDLIRKADQLSQSDHYHRMELLTAAQVYATLAGVTSPEPPQATGDGVASVPPSSSVTTVGRLVLRGNETKDRMSLRRSAQDRMYELLLKHGGVEPAESFITEERCARITGEIIRGKYGDIDLATETELAFYLGVITEAQKIVAVDGAL